MYIYGYLYCYGNGPYWTTKYRISSDPPLNACLARLCGGMDVACVSGGVGCMFLLFVQWWCAKGSLFFLPSTDGRPRPVGWEGVAKLGE